GARLPWATAGELPWCRSHGQAAIAMTGGCWAANSSGPGAASRAFDDDGSVALGQSVTSGSVAFPAGGASGPLHTARRGLPAVRVAAAWGRWQAGQGAAG